MRSLPALLLFALVALPALCGADAPPISEEIVLDHGFRYEDLVDWAQRCAVAVSDSTVLLAYGSMSGYDGVRGYRRGPRGAEIDINGQDLGPGWEDVGPFDLSDFDGVGWKIVYLSDWTSDGYGSLWVRSLEGETLESTGDDVELVAPGERPLWSPAISNCGDLHIVAWAEGGWASADLKLARVSRDLEILGPSPLILATDVWLGSIALATTDSAGAVIWSTPERQLAFRALDAEGFPVGQTRSIGSVQGWPDPAFDICSFGDGWFLAWTAPQSVAYVWLDSDGEVLPPGPQVLDSDAPDQGLAVCAADSIALVTWRDQYGETIVAVRVAEGGTDPDRIVLAEENFYINDEWPRQDRRNLACAWTGESFVVLWNQFHSPPVGKRRETRRGLPKAATGLWDGWPVLSQWLPLEGDPLFEQPLLISQQARPADCGVYRVPEGWLAVVRDRSSSHYIHTFVLDQDGQPANNPQRYRTPVSLYHDCGIWTCEGGGIHGMTLRPWGEFAAVAYVESYSYSSYYVTYTEQDIIVDLVASDGSLADRIGVVVEHTYEWPSASVGSFDVAKSGGSLLVAYDWRRGWGSSLAHVTAKQTDLDGTLIGTWSVVSDSACTKPAIAALNDRALIVWLEGSRGQTSLRQAILDPDEAGDEIIGDAVVSSFGVHGAPRLIPGPEQVLLVFPADLTEEGLAPTVSTGFDIYALRFGLDGAPLDPDPIPLCQLPGDQGNVQGVWDENQYLITWSNTDEGSDAIFGGRIGDNGAVIDPDGFPIAGGMRGIARLASDEIGNVAVAYDGQRIRLIEDLVPLLDDEDWPEEEEPTEPDDPDSASVSRIRIGRLVPNPSAEGLGLDLDLPEGTIATVSVYDATGRRLLACTLTGGRRGPGPVWDGRLPSGSRAPSGVYYVRISAGGKEVVRKALLLH